MRRLLLRLAVLGLGAFLALGLALGLQVAASSPAPGIPTPGPGPSKLAGERFRASPFRFQASCNPAGVSTIEYRMTGRPPPGSPFPGAFTATGAVTIGPQSLRPRPWIDGGLGLRVGRVTAFVETFSIADARGTIHGSTHLANTAVWTDTLAGGPPPGWFSWGRCVERPTASGRQTIAFGVSAGQSAWLPGYGGDDGVVLAAARSSSDAGGQIAATVYEETFASGGCPRSVEFGKALFPC